LFVATAEAREFLTEARSLIGASWTQHADARAVDGRATDPWSADAASWSLLGALVAVYERFGWSYGQAAALQALAGACELLAETLDSDSLSNWNDAPGRTQTDVVTTLDEAARLDGKA
jgi:hypothetical protein